MIESLEINDICDVLKIDTRSSSRILLNCATIHPDEKLGHCNIYWLAQDQADEELVKLNHDRAEVNPSIGFDMFTGLGLYDLALLDQEPALIEIEDGSKFEGIIKVSFTSSTPSVHFLPLRSDQL